LALRWKFKESRLKPLPRRNNPKTLVNLLAGVFLLVRLASISDVATNLVAEGVKVGPVHQATLIVPLVHASKLNPVANAKRNAPGQVNVVGYQYRLAITHVEYESLMPRAIVVVGYQAPHKSVAFYPGARISFAVFSLYRISHSFCSFTGPPMITR
jgi:hypothetical protein